MICGHCEREKKSCYFAVYRDREGNQRRRGVCRGCFNQKARSKSGERKGYRRNYNRKNRTRKRIRDAERRAEAKRYVDSIKAKTPCKDCDRKYPPVCMDFDHVKGGKIRGIATMVSGAYKLDLIKDEIKKCELVCANCHRVRTHLRDQHYSPKTMKLRWRLKHNRLRSVA